MFKKNCALEIPLVHGIYFTVKGVSGYKNLQPLA